MRSTCGSLLWIGLLAFPASAQETSARLPSIDLIVRLEQGRFYSLKDACREINEKLGADDDLDAVADRRRELTPADRLALVLAAEAGLMRVRIEADRFVVSVPDREDVEVRLRNRRRISRLLGIPLEDWPAEKGLHLPDPFDPAQRTVVLIHGLEAGPGSMNRLREAFEHSGVQVTRFDYPNDGPPTIAGEHLSRDLKHLADRHPSLRTTVVGHSLGGLVARYALETPGLDPGNVTDLVCLGTPHQGSALAGMQPWIEVLAEGLPNGFRHDVLLQSGLGEAAIDLRPASRFLRELDQRERPKGIRYHVGIGRKGLLSPEQQNAATQQVNDFLTARNASPHVRSRVLRALSAPELRTGVGDGAVTVESATLPKVDTVRHFDRNHLELVDLPGDRPEQNDVFRWILEALRWE